MNEEICALDHVDNINGLITRSGANLNFATHELLSDQRTIGDECPFHGEALFFGRRYVGGSRLPVSPIRSTNPHNVRPFSFWRQYP